MTALMYAVVLGYDHTVKTLIDWGAALDLEDSVRGRSPELSPAHPSAAWCMQLAKNQGRRLPCMR